MTCQGKKIKKRLETLKDKLEECIEPRYGLLPKLASSEVLNDRELEEIQSKGSSPYTLCVELLKCMRRKTPSECEQFIVALNEEEQKHVVNYITRKAHRFETNHTEYNCWPLEQIHRNRIIRNLHQLVEMIDCEGSALIGTLYQHHSINIHQMDSIMKASTKYEKNMKLMTMLRRRSIRDYNVLVEFLQESYDMSFLACLFTEDKVVETVDCTIVCPSAERVRELEDRIVHKFRLIRRFCTWINRFMHRDCHANTELAAMKVGYSIRCFFFCGTPDALQSLYISINNGTLITTMQCIFQQLLGCEESVFVVKITGRLNQIERRQRVEEFCRDIGSTEIAKDLSETDVSGPRRLFWFPYEVLEPILLQLAVKLFKVNQVRLLLSRPDVTAINTISSVCRDWFEVITGRKILRRQLKLTFRKSTVLPVEMFKAAILLRLRSETQPMTSRDADVNALKTLASVCRRWMVAVGESGDPKGRLKRQFQYNPHLLITLSVPPTDSDGHHRRAQDVVTLNNCVYVVYEGYNKVEVFDCEDCYKKVEDIEVEGLEDPWDMVGSSVTSQLFISDWMRDVIWRVNLKTGVSDVFVKLATSESRVSLFENRLLVTSLYFLKMYDIQPHKLRKSIPLTENWETKHVILHAIESNINSIFVSNRQVGKTDKVSEIDSEGRVIRVFNNDEQLRCGHLALDSVGRLLIADGKNSCVVLIDVQLRYKRILIDKKRLNNSSPWRLNYNKNNNRLAVSLRNGQVKIFEYCRLIS